MSDDNPYNENLHIERPSKPVPEIHQLSKEEFGMTLTGLNGEKILEVSKGGEIEILSPEGFSKFLRIYPPTIDQVTGTILKVLHKLQTRVDTLENGPALEKSDPEGYYH